MTLVNMMQQQLAAAGPMASYSAQSAIAMAVAARMAGTAPLQSLSPGGATAGTLPGRLPSQQPMERDRSQAQERTPQEQRKPQEQRPPAQFGCPPLQLFPDAEYQGATFACLPSLELPSPGGGLQMYMPASPAGGMATFANVAPLQLPLQHHTGAQRPLGPASPLAVVWSPCFLPSPGPLGSPVTQQPPVANAKPRAKKSTIGRL